MNSSVIEIKNQDGEVIKYETVELEITTPLTVTVLPTLFPTIEEAIHEADKLNKELATRRSDVPAAADTLAEMNARVEDVVASVPEVADAVTPAEELAGIAGRIAEAVACNSTDNVGVPAAAAAAIAKKLVAEALERVPKVAEALTPDEVEDAIAFALEEVGIDIDELAGTSVAKAIAEVVELDSDIVAKIVAEEVAPVPKVTESFKLNDVEAIILERVTEAVFYAANAEAVTPVAIKAIITTRVHEIAAAVANATAEYEGILVPDVDVPLVVRILEEVAASEEAYV